MVKLEKIYKELAKKLIIESKRDLPLEIGNILVKRKVRTIKGGEPILLGDFESLPKKKRERVYQIAEKMYKFFEEKKSLFNMSDIIDLKNYDKLLTKRGLRANE